MTGHVGEVVQLTSREDTPRDDSLVHAAFGPPTGAIAPALCTWAGEACWTRLPEGHDDWVDAAPTRAVATTWAGDDITVGPHLLPLTIDRDAGVLGYTGAIAARLDGPARVRLGGELGPLDRPDALPSSDGIVLTEPPPGAVLDLTADAVPVHWDPYAEGRILIEVRGLGQHRLWGLAGDGSAVLDLSFLGPVALGDAVEVVAWRWAEERLDVHGNEVWVRSVVRQPMVAAASEPPSCADILASAPGSPSGAYRIQPEPLSPPLRVWCDMEVDGGGWTLVGSSRGATLSDEAGPWHPDLGRARPTGATPAVWDGLRGRTPDEVRFTCRHDADDAEPTVDLSFRGVDWYRTITTGTEAESCFLVGDGAGFVDAPERRDNRTGEVLPAGTPWAAGYLEGEDACREPRDFTVDLRDRGMDGNQSDGTDWGLDDDMPKCGTEGAFDGEWQLWVR